MSRPCRRGSEVSAGARLPAMGALVLVTLLDEALLGRNSERIRLAIRIVTAPSAADPRGTGAVTISPPRRGRHGGPLEITMLSRSVTWKDLQFLRLRRRRAHELRRTGISLFRNAGASRDIPSWGTHGRPRNRTIDGYTTFDWETICAEIAKLDLENSPTAGTRLSRTISWIYGWICRR
jgi:hypothetical protein